MKSKKIILVASLFALAVGVSAIGVLAVANPNNIETVSASRVKAFTGLYKKVTSTSEFGVDDKVLLASKDGDVLRDAGGNPGYLYTTREKAYRNKNGEFIYADNAYVVELTVCSGITDDSIALRGEFRMGWGSKKDYDGYIAYDRRGSNNSNPGPIDYTDVGIQYWKDYTGLRNNIIGESSWNVSFSEEGYICLDNVAGHGRLGWTSGYDNRFVIGGGSINLYKKVAIANISVAKYPEKSFEDEYVYHYKRGEKIDFSGLEFDVTFTGNPLDISTFYYDDDRNYFTHAEYATGTGYVDVPVTLVNQKAKNIQICVDQNDQNYIHVTRDLGDFRGNCILAVYYEDEYGGGYNAFGYRVDNGADDPRTASVDGGGIITITAGARMNSTFFELVKIDGKYHLVKELQSGTKYVGSNGGTVLQNEATDANALEVEYDSTNHCVFLKLYGTNSYLRFAGYLFEFSENTSNRAQLYKQELSGDEYDSIDTFVSGFHNATKACIADGRTLGITEEIWDAQETAFEALTSGAQSVIAGTTYNHNQELYGSIYDIVDRYDYIITKYSQFEDFMGRSENSSYENNYVQSLGGLLMSANQNNGGIIILAASITIISSFGIFLVIKKRKEAKR